VKLTENNFCMSQNKWFASNRHYQSQLQATASFFLPQHVYLSNSSQARTARTTKHTLTMTSQIASNAILSLRYEAGELQTNNKFQLNHRRPRNLGLIVVPTFETERSVTLFCNSLTGTGLDLVEAIRSGLLELVVSGKDDVIVVPPATSPPLGQMNIPPKPSPQHLQKSFGVFTDTTQAVWKEILQSGHTYGIRLSKNKGEVFAHYTDELDDQPENLASAQKLSVSREGSTYNFTVHDDPAAPKVFARLEMPHQAHLTGPTPFTFSIKYTTDSLETLVVDKSRSPLSVFSDDLNSLEKLVDCRDVKTGERVPWCAFFGQWDSDPHPKFPDDDDFIEISADKPWRFECTIENLENEAEYVRSMEGLEAGRMYKARVAGQALSAFSRWQYGRKADLLKGTQEEKMKRWEVDMDKLGTLRYERVGEDVEFETVA
jgi:hypothetical protein